MSLLCKLGYHRWKEYSEIAEMNVILPPRIPIQKILINLKLRKCRRCLKKQKEDRNYEAPVGPPRIWIDINNNKEEKREIALKKLNIK